MEVDLRSHQSSVQRKHNWTDRKGSFLSFSVTLWTKLKGNMYVGVQTLFTLCIGLCLVTMVTKFPNHWWASSCPTTSATHCLEDEQEFLGSISRAVSLEDNRMEVNTKAAEGRSASEHQQVSSYQTLGLRLLLGCLLRKPHADGRGGWTVGACCCMLIICQLDT